MNQLSPWEDFNSFTANGQQTHDTQQHQDSAVGFGHCRGRFVSSIPVAGQEVQILSVRDSVAVRIASGSWSNHSMSSVCPMR
jgi:hypothetical protein